MRKVARLVSSGPRIVALNGLRRDWRAGHLPSLQTCQSTFTCASRGMVADQLVSPAASSRTCDTDGSVAHRQNEDGHRQQRVRIGHNWTLLD